MLLGEKSGTKMNGAMDIAKLLMAILVIGIHTEPFGFNFWLDKGFGMITRLCVPFFFVASGYYFWIKEHPFVHFVKRIFALYLIWSLIYLPFDINNLSQCSLGEIARRFLWDGNEHALWYLCGSLIGFIITYTLLKILKPKAVLIIGMVLLIIGILKSTYSCIFESLFSLNVPDFLGSRNGLFYGFPYISLGMYIAKSKTKGIIEKNKIILLYLAFILSTIFLGLESLILVVLLKTTSTILWLSVVPYTYYFFLIVLNTEVQLPKEITLIFRKTSTLMYVSQYLFIYLFASRISGMLLFFVVLTITVCFSLTIIYLSKIKWFKFLHYLY